MDHVLIAVPTENAAELTELQELLAMPEVTIESKPFDGVTIAQVLIPVTVLSVPVLTTWIRSRFEHRRSQSVSFRGMKFTGYSPDEIEQLVELLEDESRCQDD